MENMLRRPEISSSASWSYTATATLWKRQTRDDWTGGVTFAAPVQFLCDYSAKAEKRTAGSSVIGGAKGAESVSQLVLYTERADIVPGDRVMLGTSAAADPIAAGAIEVLAVNRSADTFERTADDFEIVC
jgi:hypothetical protein